MAQMSDLRSVSGKDWKTESPYIDQILLDQVEMDTGKVILRISFCQKYYYEVLSELTGTQIRSEYELISLMKELSSIKRRIQPDQGCICGCEDERLRSSQPEERRDSSG